MSRKLRMTVKEITLDMAGSMKIDNKNVFSLCKASYRLFSYSKNL